MSSQTPPLPNFDGAFPQGYPGIERVQHTG